MLTTARNLWLLRHPGLAGVVLLCVLPTSGPGSAQETGGTYTNPVSKGSADTFADPSIIKAGDGYWYVPSFGHAERRLP